MQLLARRAWFHTISEKQLTEKWKEKVTLRSGTELARKYKRNIQLWSTPLLATMESEAESVIAVIVAAADALSAARQVLVAESLELY